MREGGGKGAGGREYVAEGIVGVERDDSAGCSGVGDTVSVVIVGRVVEVATFADGKKAADAAGALKRTGKVLGLKTLSARRDAPRRRIGRLPNRRWAIRVWRFTARPP